MRIKAKYPAVTDDRMEGLNLLRLDIDVFIDKATDGAVSLYTISDTCASFQSSGLIQRQVAITLTTVVGALTSLTRAIDAAPNRPLLSLSDVQYLSGCLQNCAPIFTKIVEAVRNLDDYLGRNMLVAESRAPPSYNAFRKGEDVEPQRLLTECFREATRMEIAARAEYFTQYNMSSEELIRLRRSLSSNTFKAPPAQGLPFTQQESAPQDKNTHSPPMLFPTLLPISPSQPQPQPSSYSAPTQEQYKMAKQFTHTILGYTHLEAYILRPQAHSIKDSSIIVYNSELLHLDDVGLESHIAKLGPDYSVLETVGELLPDQLRIIQERTKARQGALVSAQHGKEVDMVTQMGTFKVKSVVFVIKTAAEKEKEKGLFGIRDEAIVSKGCAFPGPATAATNNFGGGLFSGTKSLFPLPAAVTPNAGSSPFNGANTQSYGTGFRTDAPPRALAVSTGGPAFYTETCARMGVSEYMSITSAEEHRDKSFEELRLANYKSGHTNCNINKPTGLFGQKSNCGFSLFGNPTAPHKIQPGGFFGTVKGPAPLFGRPSGGFGTAYAPSTTAVGFPSALAPQAESVLKAGPVLDAIANNPFANLALPSKPPSPRSETCRECSKSFMPYGDSKLCAECVRKASCWLCGPKIQGEHTVTPKADDQKVDATPAETASKEDAQTPSTQEELETSLSALTIAPDLEVETTEKTDQELAAERKQKAKEKDFQSDHEIEYLWSARYDQLEARRIADAKKLSKESDCVYTVDPNVVTWGKKVKASSVSSPFAGLFAGKVPTSNKIEPTLRSDNSVSSNNASAGGGGLFGGNNPNSNMFGTATRTENASGTGSASFGSNPIFKGLRGSGDKGKDAEQEEKEK